MHPGDGPSSARAPGAPPCPGEDTAVCQYVPPLARPGWVAACARHPVLSALPRHRVSEIGIKLLGLPLGSVEFVRAFLATKLSSQGRLHAFIRDMATVGLPMEAAAVTREGAAQMLRHLLRPLPLASLGASWLRDVDDTIIQRLYCHVVRADRPSSQSLYPDDGGGLTAALDLSNPMSGEDLPSLELGAAESHFGSVALVLAPLRSVLASRPGHAYQSLAAELGRPGVSGLLWARHLRAADASLHRLRDLSDSTVLWAHDLLFGA